MLSYSKSEYSRHQASSTMSILLKSLPMMNIRHSSWFAGAIKDAGDTFAQKGNSEKNVFFYNLEKEQLEKLKGNF